MEAFNDLVADNMSLTLEEYDAAMRTPACVTHPTNGTARILLTAMARGAGSSPTGPPARVDIALRR
jgi:hypothetical protein